MDLSLWDFGLVDVRVCVFTNGEEVGESSRDQSERECKQLEDEFAVLEAQELDTFNMEVSGLSWFVRNESIFFKRPSILIKACVI